MNHSNGSTVGTVLRVLTHIVTIRIKDEATDKQVAALVRGLRKLPDQIPEIQSYTVGQDMGLIVGNCDVAIVARFASADDLRAYIAHPAHVKVVRQLLDPIAAERLRIQFPSPDPGD